MAVGELTLEDVRARVPQLALFTETGFVAAFAGEGGLYVVYNPPSDPLALLSKLHYICVMRDRPVLVLQVLDEPISDWGNARFAKNAAKALAAGTIRAKPAGGSLHVGEADLDKIP